MRWEFVYTCNVTRGVGGREKTSDDAIIYTQQPTRSRVKICAPTEAPQCIQTRERAQQTHTHIIDGTTTHPRIISPFDETGVLHLRYILVHVIRRTDRTIVIIRVVVPGTYYQTVVGRRIPTHVVVVPPPPLLFETCHLFFIYLDSRRALLAHSSHVR